MGRARHHPPPNVPYRSNRHRQTQGGNKHENFFFHCVYNVFLSNCDKFLACFEGMKGYKD